MTLKPRPDARGFIFSPRTCCSVTQTASFFVIARLAHGDTIGWPRVLLPPVSSLGNLWKVSLEAPAHVGAFLCPTRLLPRPQSIPPIVDRKAHAPLPLDQMVTMLALDGAP
jgi:hypothetical protein